MSKISDGIIGTIHDEVLYDAMTDAAPRLTWTMSKKMRDSIIQASINPPECLYSFLEGITEQVRKELPVGVILIRSLTTRADSWSETSIENLQTVEFFVKTHLDYMM